MIELRAFVIGAALSIVTAAGAATWYVDGSMPESGDGKSWETAFSKIAEGIDAASEGDTIIVSQGVYGELVRFRGPNLTLRSRDPLDSHIVAMTVIDGSVQFSGLEDEACILSGFTIRGGDGGSYGAGGGVYGAGTRATIRRNVITGNYAYVCGGGLALCHGLIENNVIVNNVAGNGWTQIGLGGGVYGCDGVIRNNIIAGNIAQSAFDYPNLQWVPGRGGALYGCDGTIENNTMARNVAYPYGGGLYDCKGVIRNCIIWVGDPFWGDYAEMAYSTVPAYSCSQGWTGGGEGNITEDPKFVDAENGDFRLRADSPCIDAGFNSPDSPETDIAGMHRIMFGGKSLTVDMGAYEFYINNLTRGPSPHQTTFIWSSLADKTYSIFYTDDLFAWHLATAKFPSSGNQTTSWLDDGSLTGVPPSLAPRRFYRLLENQ